MSGLTYKCEQTGEIIDLDNPETAMTQGAYDIRGFSWGWDMSDAGALSGGGRQARKAKLPVACRTREHADALVDAIEYDALAGTPGTFESEGWQCRALASVMSLSAVYESRVEMDLELLMVDGCWRKSTTVHFLPNSADLVNDTAGLDYPSDFGPPPMKMPELHIVNGPHDATCDEGGSAAMSVRAIGYRLAYEWQLYADGSWIPAPFDGANSSLVIIPGNEEYSGASLRCIVTDGTGQSVTTASATFRMGGLDFPHPMFFDYGPTGAITQPFQASADGRIPSYIGSQGTYEKQGGFDYVGNARASLIDVETKAGALARITFFGPCASPYVVIAGNVYGVSGASAAAGEMIVIDPLGQRVPSGSVYRVGKYGERTNLYHKRRRGVSGSGSYPFERIPHGASYVSWPQSIGVDVEVIEERGTPPWS